MKNFQSVIRVSFFFMLFIGTIFIVFGILIPYLAGNGHIILALLVGGLFLFPLVVAHVVANYDEYINGKKKIKRSG